MESSSKNEQPITLYRGWDLPGKYVWSPFVTKLELRMRVAGLMYKADCGSVQSSPKGKIPYIAILETDSMSDSALIISEMIQQNLVPDINGKLSTREQAFDLALRAMMEDKLYFYHVSGRI